MQKARIALFAAIIVASTNSLTPAHAAPSLQDVQIKVQTLQEEATAAAEGAQAARVQLDALTRTLNGIKQQAAAQGETVAQLRKSLGAIAISQYKSGGLSEGLELLFRVTPLSISLPPIRSTPSHATRLFNFANMQQQHNALMRQHLPLMTSWLS